MAKTTSIAKTAAEKTITPVATTPPALTDQETIDAYQNLYDALGRAYWDASDIHSKDTVQGARDAVYDIITELNKKELEANTQKFLALVSTIRATNKALAAIQDQINQITRNIGTAASVMSTISKILKYTSAL
jgi:type I site-specific restriction-modification system R (restriction) subunit